METEREHIESKDCWCKPEVIFETHDGAQVWIHKGPGDDLTPAPIIAQAIADVIAGEED